MRLRHAGHQVGPCQDHHPWQVRPAARAKSVARPRCACVMALRCVWPPQVCSCDWSMCVSRTCKCADTCAHICIHKQNKYINMQYMRTNTYANTHVYTVVCCVKLCAGSLRPRHAYIQARTHSNTHTRSTHACANHAYMQVYWHRCCSARVSSGRVWGHGPDCTLHQRYVSCVNSGGCPHVTNMTAARFENATHT